MKFFQVALALTGATLISAQACSSAVSAVPTCGAACITSAASAVGCAATDYACQCSSSQFSAIETAAEACVISSCGVVTAVSVLSAASAVCTACD